MCGISVYPHSSGRQMLLSPMESRFKSKKRIAAGKGHQYCTAFGNAVIDCEQG